MLFRVLGAVDEEQEIVIALGGHLSPPPGAHEDDRNLGGTEERGQALAAISQPLPGALASGKQVGELAISLFGKDF